MAVRGEIDIRNIQAREHFMDYEVGRWREEG
jgi:hypothetical protein